MPRILVFSIFLLLPYLAGAQAPQEEYLQERIETREFDHEKWKSLSEGIDYTEEEPEEPEEPKPERSRSSDSGPANIPSGFGTFLQYFIIVAGILLILFLLVKVLSKDGMFGPRNRKLSPVSAMELEQIEENLQEAELDDPIRRAIAAGDYAMAVRLYYLSVLKELAAKELIRWKRDKTNGEYLRELAGSPLWGKVQEVTLIFERVWYGKVELRSEDFPAIETKMKAAVSAVRSQKLPTE